MSLARAHTASIARASSSSAPRAPRAARLRARRRAVAPVARATTSPDTDARDGAAGANIVVLGGGFGGLYTALKLDALEWRAGAPKPTITIVDRAERFVFKPLLYELVNETLASWEVAPTFAELLAPTNVKFVKGDVVGFEPENASVARDGTPCSTDGGTCALRDGGTVPYDYLVLALGTSTSDGGVIGAKENAIALNTAEDAERMAKVLGDLERDGKSPRVAVIGGGLSGVELSAVIAERLAGKAAGGIVDMITPSGRVMAGAPPGQREAAMKVLDKANVNVVGGRVTRLDRVEAADDAGAPSVATKVTMNDANGEESEQMYDLVCWTVGQRAETPSDWPLSMTATRKVKTDATLRVNGHSRVYAVGDASSSAADLMDTNFDVLPSTAQVAFQQADYAAWNVWASINGRAALPFRYQHIGDMMVLGALDAAVALPVGDITIDGPAAAALRRVAYLYRMPTNEHRIKVAQRWLEDGVEDFARDPAAFLSRLPNPFATFP